MTQNLEEYNLKRNFDKTLEPQGSDDYNSKEMRFVIQHHLATRDHYDLRLEWRGVLMSWAVPKGFSNNPKTKRLSIKVEDHPLDYRNFEGTIPKGEYGGGIVMLWDEGYWEPSINVDEGLEEGTLKFKLNGHRLKGNWALIRLKAKEGDKNDNWLLLKEKDKYANEEDIIEFDTSVRSGRTMKEIEQGKEINSVTNPFDSLSPQLAKLSKKTPKGDDWVFELKYDGYRILAFIENNRVKLISRNGIDYTKTFISVTQSLIDMAKGKAMVIDGEMTITDEQGKTNFQFLQSYVRDNKSQRLTYFAFDLLAIDGEDIRGYPLIKRKELLEEIMQDASHNLHYSRHIEGKGDECFRIACKLGMEGIVGKKADSIYSGTRNGDWIKIKCDNRQEFVIGGYTCSDKKKEGISSIILGIYEGDDLVYIGRAGTGFNKFNTDKLTEKFANIKKDISPFINEPESRKDEKVIWLYPKLIAEIKFSEWTSDKQLRHASFVGLREDKTPKDIRIEKDEDIQNTNTMQQSPQNVKNKNEIIHGVKISNPDKIIYDEIKLTKLDVVKYYEAVANRILPYISNRVLSIVRCPKGVEGMCFYKKHPGTSSKGIKTILIDSEKEEYFYLDDILGLISEAQMGTIEFHNWGSKIDSLDKPDIMVFDLDPDEGMNLDIIRQGARDLKSVLDELRLKSFLKTSGGKGYHIVVPFKPNATWDRFNEFAKRVAQVMEQKWPNRYTSNMRKSKRNNKIFIDWVRNSKGATSIAPYSLRARKGAKVSMPIDWHELESVAPDSINMSKALERLYNEDPWIGFFDNNQQL